MKKIIIILLILLVILIPAFFGLKKIWDHYDKLTAEQHYKLAIEKKIEIKRGEPVAEIAKKLKREKLIVSDIFFMLMAQSTKTAKTLKAGEYLINNNLITRQIIELLNKGTNVFYKVTIPEGLTIQEIAKLLARRMNPTILFSAEKFIEICNSNLDYIKKELNIDVKSAEGFLFPETYTYTKNDNEYTIFQQMIKQFKKQTVELQKNLYPLNFNFYDIIILASIVQMEATIIDEMPRIAGVYINRLKIGMKLEADPTVIYAHGYFIEKLNYLHLKIDSPYNTYKYAGLPPTPICNPGLAAIKHTINYEQHNFLYFVANIDGSHSFATNIKDHNFYKNQRKIQLRNLEKQKKAAEKSPIKRKIQHPKKKR